MVETDAGLRRPPHEPPGLAGPEATTAAPGPDAGPPAEGLPARVFLMTPSEWLHLDLSGDPLANARRLVDRIAEGAGDDKARLKLRVAAALQGAVRDALRNGAIMAAFYAQVVEGHTVGASVVVAARPLPREVLRDGQVDLTLAVRTVAGAGAGENLVEAGPVDLPAGPAYRVQKEQVASVMGERHETVVVQYFLPVPGRLAVIVATFSTPTLEVAGSMVALFDAMATSLRWRA
jgi:hypothetical protein